ncbi:MAG: DUF4468 domain-containing protein [Bacteroidetes bacterium]|nr:DUF4468 domain-containing protein [Bacteroidota bacterium]
MKYIFISVAITLVSEGIIRAQSILSSDETETMEFENIVAVDSLSKYQLFKNAMSWIAGLRQNDEKFELKLKDSIDGKVYGLCSFFVYAQAGILKKISGAISYNLSIEVKDNKYRYHFNNFLFHYYRQDRYYNMIESGKTKPATELNATGWQKLWTQHQATIVQKMKNNCKLLHAKMKESPKSSAKIVAKKIEW